MGIQTREVWVHELDHGRWHWVRRTIAPVSSKAFRDRGWWQIVETGKFVNQQDATPLRSSGPPE